MAATSINGFWESGALCTVYFKIKKELPADGVSFVCHVDTIEHYEKQYAYDVTTVDGRIVPVGTEIPAQPNIGGDVTEPRLNEVPPSVPKHNVGSTLVEDATESNGNDGSVAALPEYESDATGAISSSAILKDSVAPVKLEAEKQSTASKSETKEPKTSSTEIESVGEAVAAEMQVAAPDVLDITEDAPNILDAADKASSDNGAESMSKWLIVLLAVAAVAVLGGAVAVWLARKRRK